MYVTMFNASDHSFQNVFPTTTKCLLIKFDSDNMNQSNTSYCFMKRIISFFECLTGKRNNKHTAATDLAKIMNF